MLAHLSCVVVNLHVDSAMLSHVNLQAGMSLILLLHSRLKKQISLKNVFNVKQMLTICGMILNNLLSHNYNYIALNCAKNIF